jgi:hypothetical protein
LTAGAAIGSSDFALTGEALERLDISGTGPVGGMRWGPLALPDLSLRREGNLPDAGWGDDGKLGFAMLLRFQSHLDMPHRWIYVRPVGR